MFSFLSVAPSSVELKGPREARSGDVLSFECTTSNSNPPATIQWVVDNVTYASLHSRTTPSPLGGWVTHANVSVRVSENDRNKIITCNVINSELNAVKTESAILTVICKYNFKNLIREISVLGRFLAIFVIMWQSSDRNKIITCNVVNSELNAIEIESALLTVVCKLISLQAKYLANLLGANKMNHISGTIDFSPLYVTRNFCKS